MTLANSIVVLAMAGVGAAHAGEQLAAPSYTLTGHVDLVSAYFLRGATSTYGNAYPGLGNSGADAPESSRPVLQWGADYVHSSGWYAGYWGSRINYSYRRLGQSYDDRGIVAGFQDDKSIENDLYGGYAGKAGELSYTLGLTAYLYLNGKYADGVESKLGLAYRDFGINAQSLLNDTVWGNRGDTYWSLTYTAPLPHGISFNATAGWYVYAREGKFLGSRDTLSGTACGAGSAFVVNGCYAGSQPVGSAFRHLTLGISQPIAATGLTWSLQGIVGGENRFGVRQANKGVASISYSF